MQRGDIVIRVPSEDTISPLHWKDLVAMSKIEYAEYTERTNPMGYTIYEVTNVIQGHYNTTVCLIDLSTQDDNIKRTSIAKETQLRIATPYEIVQWRMKWEKHKK